jgi:hypothetical protein
MRGLSSDITALERQKHEADLSEYLHKRTDFINEASKIK